MRPARLLLVLVSVSVCASSAYAQLYSQDFEVDDTANWKVNNGPSDEAHDFFFDYSTVGIPPAPNGAGTRGMKLQANLNNGVFSGMSVSPIGLNLVGSYKLEFDLWANANGPFPAGGSGSTNLSTVGVLTSGNVANWPGVADSVWFAASAEGGTTADYRAYSPTAVISYQDGDPVYAPALVRNATDPYYVSSFPGATPPAAQTTLFAQQNGALANGTIGETWRRGKVTKSGPVVKWYIDDVLLATVDTTGMTLGGGNIMFGHSDINAGSSADPNDIHLLFTLIDNIVVDPFVGPPVITVQPASQAAIVDGSATFTVTAVSNVPGLPNLHYQWQRTQNAVTTNVGTDSPSYTVTNVQYADNGTTFNVIVTDENSPAGSVTSNSASLIVLSVPCEDPFADADDDDDVDMDDFGAWQLCYSGSSGAGYDKGHCACFDRDFDNDVDLGDFAKFKDCASGPAIPAAAGCDDYPTGTVVINEFSYDNTGTASREFVELYNAGGAPVDISGWVLRASDTVAPGPIGDDNPDYTIPGTPGSGLTMLPAGGFYVLGTTVPNVNQTVGTTALWENDNEAIQLLDGNGNVVDVVIYERNKGPVAVSPGEGGIWGNFQSVVASATSDDSRLSLSRWADGYDTNVNGRDFGTLPETPGAPNNPGTIAQYVPPDVDGATSGDVVAGITASFRHPRAIAPGDTTTLVAANVLNPAAFPASPQGGNAIIAWDPSGGGNAAFSNASFFGTAKFDIYAYLDTTDLPASSNASNVFFRTSEETAYGIGTMDGLANLADVSGLVGVTDSAHGATGIMWYYEKVGNAVTSAGVETPGTFSEKLYLIDAGPGGDGGQAGTIPFAWTILGTVDLSVATTSHWYRIAIQINPDGTGVGTFNDPTSQVPSASFPFVTVPNFRGGFYIGYRENAQVAAVTIPTFLRPPTFDRVP